MLFLKKKFGNHLLYIFRIWLEYQYGSGADAIFLTSNCCYDISNQSQRQLASFYLKSITANTYGTISWKNNGFVNGVAPQIYSKKLSLDSIEIIIIQLSFNQKAGP